MEDYIINVGQIEELQTINDINSLDIIFQRAKRTIVGGGIVALVRQQRMGKQTGLKNSPPRKTSRPIRKTYISTSPPKYYQPSV